MEIKVYNSIMEIDEKAWDAIVERDRIICRHSYLKAIERSNINDCEYHYPVVYERDKIVAHACAYSISTELDIFAKGLTKKLINGIRKVWKNFLIMRSMECGTPVAPGNTISFSEGTDEDQSLALIVGALENLAAQKNINIVLARDFYDDDLHFYDCLQERGFKRVNNLPNTILKIKWDTFDDYLASMKSHYRCKVKKNIRAAQEKGVREEIVGKFSFLSDSLQTLWQNVYDQAKDYRREVLTQDFFRNMDECLNGRTRMILFKEGESLRGFGLVLVDDDTLRYMFTGLDYDFNKECCIYLNSLYSVIKLAISQGKKEVDMGITAYFPKTDVGAKIVNLYVYMKHLNPLINPIISFAFKALTPAIRQQPKCIFREEAQGE